MNFALSDHPLERSLIKLIMVGGEEIRHSTSYLVDQSTVSEHPETGDALDSPYVVLDTKGISFSARKYETGERFIVEASVVGPYTAERKEDGSLLTVQFYTADGSEVHTAPSGFNYSDKVGHFTYARYHKDSGVLRSRVQFPPEAEFCKITMRLWLPAESTIFVAPVAHVIPSGTVSDVSMENVSNIIELMKPNIHLRLSRVIKSALTMLNYAPKGSNYEGHVDHLKLNLEAAYLYALGETLVGNDGPDAVEKLQAYAELIVRTGASCNRTSLRKIVQVLLQYGKLTAACDLMEALDPEHPKLAQVRGWLRLRDSDYRVVTHQISDTAAQEKKPIKNTSKELKGIYILQSAFPHQSNGYAVRAQGLLEGYAKTDINMVPITQYGYPLDRAGAKFDGDMTHTENGITYHFMADGDYNLRQLPVDDFLQVSARYIERMARAHNADFIKAASFFTNGLPAAAAARNLGIPLIYEVRGMAWLTRGATNPRWMHSEDGLLMRDAEIAAAKQADHIFVITSALKAFLVSFGVEEDRISLLPNAVDANTSETVPVRDHALARTLGIDGAFVFGYVGSFVDYEGIDILVKAFEQAQFERPTKLLLVGDGPEFRNIEAMVSKSPRKNDIVLTGRVLHTDVGRYYSLINTATIPRLPFEVCKIISPLKPFELFRMGMPVIASDVDAIKEIFGDGMRGHLFRAGDAGDLGRCMVQAISEPELSTRMAAQAKVWVNSERTWDYVVQSAVEAFRKLS